VKRIGILVCSLLVLTGCVPRQHAIPQATINVVAHVPSLCDATTHSTIKVNEGIKYTVIGDDNFIKQVRCVLDDDRSWNGVRYVDFGADFTIRPVTQDEVIGFCGEPFPTEAENRMVSCSGEGVVYINMVPGVELKWDVMIINHEVGHQLGHDHEYGAPACTVMHEATLCEAIWPPYEDSKLALIKA